MAEIFKFPIDLFRRIANRRGARSVSCLATDRFIRFSREWQRTRHGNAVFIDVMTDGNGNERKICSLCITVEELRKVLDQVEREMVA
jgi:hypothetical protein